MPRANTFSVPALLLSPLCWGGVGGTVGMVFRALRAIPRSLRSLRAHSRQGRTGAVTQLLQMRAGKPTQPWKGLEGEFSSALLCPLGSWVSSSCGSHALFPFSTDLAPLSLVFSSLIQHCCFLHTRDTENTRLCGLISLPHSHLRDFQT